MKLDEIPEEYKDRVEFACKVCRADHRSKTGRKTNCAWRQIGNEVCFDIARAIAQTEAEKSSDYSVDAFEYAKPVLHHHFEACGSLCKECEDKAGG